MLDPDFRDMLSAFSKERVEYLVVGAHALGAHGLVRPTGDLDLWVHPPPENAGRVHRALVAFGVPPDRIAAADLARRGAVIEIGESPIRIDLLTSLTGLDFAEAWVDAVVLEIDGLEVSVLSRADLITHKRASGRPRDLEDLRWLEAESQN
jgi:Nucleotidyl transferase of unknown function (DUF2204)